MAQKTVVTNRTRSEDYREIFVYGVFGGENADYFEAIIQSYSLDAAESQKGAPEGETQNPDKIVTEVRDEVCLKMTPRVARVIYEWLGTHIETYEEAYGKIPPESQLVQSVRKE